ncbi:MAG: ROK family protein [Acidimicrobiia bacterium]|nr:ROK family protein [Acidimicrobiia bacterium]
MRIGVDLGGTKTEAIALGEDGEELIRRRVPTRRETYEDVVDTVAELVVSIEHELGADATVGAGTPGAISPASGFIKNANLTVLNGHPLDRDLSTALGREVRIANDADCLALSEATDGAGAGHRTVFAVILGTGTGGGVTVDRSIVTGPNAIGGEWGHNPLPWPTADELIGPDCYCGQRGCIEKYLSGPGMAADHERITSVRMSPPQIVAAARDGEPGAEATLERYSDRLARGLASIINILDPHVVVLAGGLSKIPELYEEVPARWGKYVFSDQVDTPLVSAAHGDSSGVRGAAWLWE